MCMCHEMDGWRWIGYTSGNVNGMGRHGRENPDSSIMTINSAPEIELVAYHYLEPVCLQYLLCPRTVLSIPFHIVWPTAGMHQTSAAQMPTLAPHLRRKDTKSQKVSVLSLCMHVSHP
jgi:hypothetical protein